MRSLSRRHCPTQANSPEADVTVSARFRDTTIWLDWTFAEAKARATFIDRLQQKGEVALQGNQAKIESPPGQRTFNLFAYGMLWGHASDATILPGQTNQVEIEVRPATITVNAVPAVAGQSLARMSFTWTISGYGRNYLCPSHDARLTATVPPGTYDVSLAVTGGTVGGDQLMALRGLTLAPGDGAERTVRVGLPQLGILTAGSLVVGSKLFAPHRMPLPELVLRDANNRETTLGNGPGPFSESLPNGSYRVLLRIDSRERAATDVVVRDGEKTLVDMMAAPSRILVHAERADRMPWVDDSDVRWTIVRAGGASIDPAQRGPVLDVTVPGGEYKVSVSTGSNGAGSDTVNVGDGQVVSKVLQLQR
ncbi:MAG: hypothetical protein ABSC06_05605 [Rhodopila sp.]|jgi:hypothetical protein